jgi:hypothetical protein
MTNDKLITERSNWLLITSGRVMLNLRLAAYLSLRPGIELNNARQDSASARDIELRSLFKEAISSIPRLLP